MSHPRELPGNKIFFRVLKNKNATANNICEKLKCEVENIVLLSDDELRELWQYVKVILLKAQKLYDNKKVKYNKECKIMTEFIQTVIMIAVKTITQRIYIPNILFQNIMLLHSLILPNMKNKQVKDEISCLLERWWNFGIIGKEKVIVNAIKYLIQSCKSSLQHVKRLYKIRSSIKLLKCTEDVEELLSLVKEKIVMSFEKGQLLILYLFTLGEQYIMGIHNNVKALLQNVECNYIATYADLYAKAWLNGTQKIKKYIVENCLQNIIFHCFRAKRHSTDREALGKNLLLFLTVMHENKSEAVRLMIHNQCEPLLWGHIKAPGSFIRCNAIEILFATSSVHYTCRLADSKKNYLEKSHKTITALLKSSNVEVCIVTMNGLFSMLEKYWNHILKDTIETWLNILLDHTKSASDSKIRANVFIGLKKLLSKKQIHDRTLIDFLPKFAYSIYDEDKMVLKALIELLWHAQDKLRIPFWNIIPLVYILDCLETTRDQLLLEELIKLVWSRVLLNGTEMNKIKDEILYIGTKNINAIRRFCLHSKPVMNWDTSVKLIETLLCTIKKEVKCLFAKETLNRNFIKKIKLDDKKSGPSEYGNKEFDSYEDMQIYIDVIATILVANMKDIEDEKFSKESNIFQLIVQISSEIFMYSKETPLNESMIYLLSLIPLRFFIDDMEIIETLAKQLCNPNTSEDTLLTLIYAFMKWNKGDTVFFALKNLFIETLNTSTRCNENISADIFQVNENNLELSLRILKHLLHAEDKSVLMNKYHKDLLKLWETLHVLRTFLDKELNNICNRGSLVSKDIIAQLFKDYITMISILHKKDIFNAPEHFSKILLWIKRTITPHVSCVNINSVQSHRTCINIIKSTFDVSNLLMKEFYSTPKLCCNIVLLYSKCLSQANAIIFLNNAFEGLITLLDVSKIAYEKQEPNLLNVVVPNFLYITMIALTRYDKDTLFKYTDDLKLLNELTQKYFSVVKNYNLCITYMNVMFYTTTSSVSEEMTRLLQCSYMTEKEILITKFPYLAEKIIKVITSTKKYQKLFTDVLTKVIIDCMKIDILSALIIIHKMIDLVDKSVINRLKNITLASKQHNDELSCDTPFERSITNAINMVARTILKKRFSY